MNRLGQHCDAPSPANSTDLESPQKCISGSVYEGIPRGSTEGRSSLNIGATISRAGDTSGMSPGVIPFLSEHGHNVTNNSASAPAPPHTTKPSLPSSG